MSRVLLMTLSAPSHINSRAALAQHLVELGHHVGWLCSPQPVPKLASWGVEVLGLPDPPTLPRIIGQDRMKMIGNDEQEHALMRRVLFGAFLGQIGHVRDVVRTFRPDVVALDGQFYHFVIGTHLEAIPWATISSTLALLQPRSLHYRMQAISDALADERLAFFSSHGMHPEFRLFDCLSPALNVVATTRELVGDAAEWPPHTFAVGPMIPKQPRGDEVEFPWHRLRGDGRIVLLAFGTGFYWNPEIIRNAAIACAELDAQLVVALMDLAETESFHDLPGDPILVPFVPQLALLSKVAAFINHGGASSVMEALFFGVPQVVVPISLDQPVQAYFVDHSGAGVAIERDQFTVERCRDALGSMLDSSSPVRRRAAEVSASYRAADGPAETARRLLALTR